MSKLGWSYPAGAENDPSAPYNQEESPDACLVCGGDNEVFDGVFCSQDCLDKYAEDSP